jgi:hypothetical protein
MVETAQFASDLSMARVLDKLRAEHDPATRESLHRLLLEEWSKRGFSLKQLGKVRRQMIEASARIAIQKAVVETLAANGQDVRAAEETLGKLVEIQRMFEQLYRAVVADAMMPELESGKPMLGRLPANTGQAAGWGATLTTSRSDMNLLPLVSGLEQNGDYHKK